MQYRFLAVVVFLAVQELVYQRMIFLFDLFRYRSGIISAVTDITFRKAMNETGEHTA